MQSYYKSLSLGSGFRLGLGGTAPCVALPLPPHTHFYSDMGSILKGHRALALKFVWQFNFSPYLGFALRGFHWGTSVPQPSSPLWTLPPRYITLNVNLISHVNHHFLFPSKT